MFGMKYVLLILVGIALTAASCKNRHKIAEQNALMETDSSNNKDTAVIADAFEDLEGEFDFDEEEKVYAYISKGACFGRCPIFNVTIYNTGRAEYQGINFAKYQGDFEFTFTEQELIDLAATAKDLGVDTMQSKYDGPITDIPMVKIGITIEGEYKEILKRYRYPKELQAFQDSFDKLIDSKEWIKKEEEEEPEKE